MLGLLVFVGSFLSFFGVTLIFPNMPPGRLLIDLLGESERRFMVAKVSGDLLLSATINGLVWGAVIGVLYSYLKGPNRGKTEFPVWVPGYATSQN